MEACTVTPDYFRAMNIPLLRGRYLPTRTIDLRPVAIDETNEGERSIAGVNVMVIDEEFARRHWPNEDPVGKRIKIGGDEKSPPVTVVGVVGRVKMDGLSQDSNRVQGYFPFAQLPFNNGTIIIKASGDPTQLIAGAREQVKAIDPNQPIYNIRTMDEIRAESVAPERLNLTLFSIFAGSPVLAIVGIYGVMSYTVTQRTHEIGIRMAIGAQTRCFPMVIAQGMMLTMIGVAFGLVGVFGLTRLDDHHVIRRKPTDPATFLGIAACFRGRAIACYIPGRRATKVDPVVSLRYE